MGRLSPEQFAAMMRFARTHQSGRFQIAGDAVRIGEASALNEADHRTLAGFLQQMEPWRKGPFELFGHRVDAHWRSNLKWERWATAGVLEHLRGASVCDIGCNNGYYLFRALASGAREVVGLDPVLEFQQNYQFMEAFHPLPAIDFQLAGFDALSQYERKFDVILCMGILYHHTDPMHILRLIHRALAPGGRLLIESLGLAGNFSDQATTLVAGKEYAGVRGVWHVPNMAALQQWCRRSGFQRFTDVGEFRYGDEQRRTDRADLPASPEFFDPENPGKLISGEPAPVRLYSIAYK